MQTLSPTSSSSASLASSRRSRWRSDVGFRHPVYVAFQDPDQPTLTLFDLKHAVSNAAPAGG